MFAGLVSRVQVATLAAIAPRLLASATLRRYAQKRYASDAHAGMDAHVLTMRAIDDVLGIGHVWKHPPQRARRNLRLSVQLAETPCLAPITTRDTFVSGPAGPIAIRSYAAPNAPALLPGVVYFHGGGWVAGDLTTHDAFCRKLAAAGHVRVLAVDYRVAPEHPFPAATTDAIAAYQAIATHATSFGVHATQLTVAGDSAGGNLAAVVAIACRDSSRPPAAQALIYPATDATCAQPSQREFEQGFVLNGHARDYYYSQYLGREATLRAANAKTWQASPLSATDAQLRGVAPAVIVVAQFDALRDEGLAYAQRLSALGVPVTAHQQAGLPHGFLHMSRLVPAAAAATAATIRAITHSATANHG